MRRFKRYKKNLSIVTTPGGDFVKSYNTLVAKIDYGNKQLLQLNWWSTTTQKHISYAASQLSLQLVQCVGAVKTCDGKVQILSMEDVINKPNDETQFITVPINF